MIVASAWICRFERLNNHLGAKLRYPGSMRSAFTPVLLAVTFLGHGRNARADGLPLLPNEPQVATPPSAPATPGALPSLPTGPVPPASEPVTPTRPLRVVYFDPPAPPKASEPEAPLRENVLSASLWTLLRPFAAVVYERRILSWLGVGALAGLGSLEIATSGKRIGFQIGPHVQAYLVGSFRHGMPLGLELLGMSSTGTLSDARAKVTAASLNPALTLGYKVELLSGVTLNVHAGLRWSASRVTVSSSDTSVRTTDTTFEPLFRTLLGYAF